MIGVTTEEHRERLTRRRTETPREPFDTARRNGLLEEGETPATAPRGRASDEGFPGQERGHRTDGGKTGDSNTRRLCMTTEAHLGGTRRDRETLHAPNPG